MKIKKILHILIIGLVFIEFGTGLHLYPYLKLKKSSVFSTNAFLSQALAQNNVPPEFEYTQYYDKFHIVNKFQSSYYNRLEQSINTLTPNVGGEIFYKFEIPQEVIESKSDKEIDKLLYQALVSFSTQEGIEYFSHRRQVYRLFIEESYVVNTVTDRKKQADRILRNEDSVPQEQKFYIYQADSSFGDGVKQVRISYNENEHQFYVQILNKETIKYKNIISIARPQEFLLTLLINRNNNEVTMYGITASNTTSFRTIRKRISISIVYRIYALAQWFERESMSRVLQ